MLLIWIVILWIVPVFVGHAIGKSKGRAGLLYGLFLGWLGVIIVAILPPVRSSATHRECPHCKETMRIDATVCPHCQRDVTASPSPSVT